MTDKTRPLSPVVRGSVAVAVVVGFALLLGGIALHWPPTRIAIVAPMGAVVAYTANFLILRRRHLNRGDWR